MEKTIIFDMDGTLLDSMPVWRSATTRLLARHGYHPKPDLQQRLVTLTLAEGSRYLLQEYGFAMDAEKMQQEIFEIVADGYRSVQPKPGVVPALRELARRGAKMCVVSSTPQELLVPVLTRLDLMQYFAFTFSCLPGQNKDKPDCYLAAMRRLGETEPARTAVFEDACHAVKTAAEAGFVVYAIADADAAAQAGEIRCMARYYLSDWAQLERMD